METGDKKWATCYNIMRKRSWSKCGEAAQTVAKPVLMARKGHRWDLQLCRSPGSQKALRRALSEVRSKAPIEIVGQLSVLNYSPDLMNRPMWDIKSFPPLDITRYQSVTRS
ncbi:hypothetical protein TNCV_3704571 [Trichonephila clavipes]|nr:hypothetical protein TNCV_3704571 [Trichonephila clavipes]